MMTSVNRLNGTALAAIDGKIGHVTDVFFDDAAWAVRYLVVSTGSLLTGREVLISPRSVRQRPVASDKQIDVGLSRDEIELVVDGRSARHHASQGQQRILTLSLKVAELSCVRDARRAHPVLLLDDVSSELDPARTGAVYAFLRENSSQVFVTTTRPELFPTPGASSLERADWQLVSGVLRRL